MVTGSALGHGLPRRGFRRPERRHAVVELGDRVLRLREGGRQARLFSVFGRKLRLELLALRRSLRPALRQVGLQRPEPDLSAESTPTGGWCQMKQASSFTEELHKFVRYFNFTIF